LPNTLPNRRYLPIGIQLINNHVAIRKDLNITHSFIYGNIHTGNFETKGERRIRRGIRPDLPISHV
jgi:hypothetical protein